jgi:hypothetical protein
MYAHVAQFRARLKIIHQTIVFSLCSCLQLKAVTNIGLYKQQSIAGEQCKRCCTAAASSDTDKKQQCSSTAVLLLVCSIVRSCSATAHALLFAQTAITLLCNALLTLQLLSATAAAFCTRCCIAALTSRIALLLNNNHRYTRSKRPVV